MPLPVRLLPLSFALLLLAQNVSDVGSGPYGPAIQQDFQRAFFRNNFNTLVSLPPLGDVRRYGSTGLIQEFSDAKQTSGVRLALVRSSNADILPPGVPGTKQVLAPMFAYYSGLGPTAAGYPNGDTGNCFGPQGAPCQYQVFSRNYLLFAYLQPIPAGQNFQVQDPFFTRLMTMGGVMALGAATSDVGTVTSAVGAGVSADAQAFVNGVLYEITSGANANRSYAVRQPVYGLYQSHGAHAGFLGLPVADEQAVAGTKRKRQNFEGGAIEYEPGSNPVLRLPVASISIRGDGPSSRLKIGDTLQLEASLFASNGATLDDRPVSWASSSSRVAAVSGSGRKATLRAVGGGAASITAVSEGTVSRPYNVFIVSECCQVGEGTPSAAIQQAFQDAVARNGLSVRVPVAAPAARIGQGYAQEVVSSSDPPLRYLVAKADSSARAFIVGGPILARYTELGGPAGALGYPAADASAAGRQLFQGGALAGSPVVLVAGPILRRWALTNYELGPAGLPGGPQLPVFTFAATAGWAQSFVGGSILAAETGRAAGQAFFVTGLIHAKYVQKSGPAGPFGLPLGEETQVSGRRRQEFEGGVIDYQVGEQEASANEYPRRPRVTVDPATIVAGNAARIAAGGFDSGATLRISVSGQPDFVVKTDSGAFAWNYFTPRAAESGLVTVRAADVNGSAVAVGAFVVQALAESVFQLRKVRGDHQVGLPGARLPLRVRIAVEDEEGHTVAGLQVRFSASPGASVEEPSSVTNGRGEAEAWVRLPRNETPVLVTAEAGRRVVTFSARPQAGEIPNFPRFQQTVEGTLGPGPGTIARQGALLAASACMLRYLQNTGALPSPNGLADPAILNDYLRDFCAFDAQGARICDGFVAAPGGPELTVNLWRLSNFAGAALSIASLPPARQGVGADQVRDALARGEAVLVPLRMPAGSHFVVAVGVAPNGAIAVHDPSPQFARPTLEDYGEPLYQSALRFLPAGAPSPGFLIVSSRPSYVDLLSPIGRCGAAFSWPGVAAAPSGPAPASSEETSFLFCEGAQPEYQLDISLPGTRRFSFTDLGNPGARSEQAPCGAAGFRITRPAQWFIEPQRIAIAQGGIVNAASFEPFLSPGTLAAVFGSGLAGAGQPTRIEIAGQSIDASGTPFQLSFPLPGNLAAGAYTLKVVSRFGTAEQEIVLLQNSPALFYSPPGQAAALNEDGSLNGPSNPARRGRALVLYGAGFAAGDEPVEAFLEGVKADVLYAGPAPGFPGVSQINLVVPGPVPPGPARSLLLRQAGRQTNPVTIAIQ